MKRIFMIIVLVCFLFSMSLTSLNAAMETSEEECLILTENDTEFCESYRTQSEIDEGNKDPKDSRSKELMEPLLSNDSEVAKIERDKMYYNWFWPAHLVVDASGVDDNWYSVDSFSNIGVMVMVLISNMLGVVNLVFSLVTMINLSVYLNDTLVSLFEIVFSFINNTFLDWSNTTGVGITIVSITGLVFLLLKIIKMLKEEEHLREIVKVSLLYIFIICLIPISYLKFMPMEAKIENMIIKETTSIFAKPGETIETTLKRDTFNTMTFNGYLMKNFGVGTIEQLAQERDVTTELARTLVKNVMKGDWEVIKSEALPVDNPTNDYIASTARKAIWQCFVSFIWLIHTILMSFILNVPIILMNIVKIFFTAFRFFIWISLFKILIRTDDIKLIEFLKNRFQWFALFLLITVIFNILINVLFKITDLISGFFITDILIIDMIIIAIYMLIWSNRAIIFEIIKTFAKNARAVITSSDFSVKDMGAEIKNTYVDAKQVKQKAKNTKVDSKNTKRTSKSKDRTKVSSSFDVRTKAAQSSGFSEAEYMNEKDNSKGKEKKKHKKDKNSGLNFYEDIAPNIGRTENEYEEDINEKDI